MRPFVEGLRVMEFARTRKDHAFPQVTFDGERAVSFTLFDTGEAFLVSGIDVFDKDRGATLVALARLEETYYDNGEYFYFPKNGLKVPHAKLRRKLPYVTFVWDSYEADRLDLNFLEPSRQLS